MRRSLLLGAVLLTACGGGLERVAFTTDLLTYKPGDRVGLSLVNVSSSSLGINLCLSRLVSNDGQEPGPADSESCTLEPMALAAGGRLEHRKTLPAEAKPGTWRYETTIRLGTGAGEVVLTPSFNVTSN